MRTVFLVLAALLLGSVAEAQQTDDLPISLDHIRAGLARPAPTLTLNLDATYQIGVLQSGRNLTPLPEDLSGGPIPAGGPLMFEQLRMFHNPTDYPLMQPYAAFTGGQVLTLTSEALARHYLEEHARQLTSK